MFCSARKRRSIDHHSAANRYHGRKLAEDETISGQEQNWFHKAQLRETRFARLEFLRGVENDLGDGLAGIGVQVNARAIFQHASGRQHRERNIQAPSCMQQTRRCQRHAARKIFDVNASKVQGGALTGDRLIGGLPVDLHSAHAHAASRGEDFQFFFFLDGARDQRSGDDGAEAFHGENAIDGQAKERSRVFGGNFGGRLREFAFQIVKPGALERADRDHGRVFEKRSAQKVFEFHAHDVECFGVDGVGLGDHGNAAADREQPADIEVLDAFAA